MRSDWFFLVLVTFSEIIFTAVCRQRPTKMRAVAEKPHDAIVKFDMYRHVQRHRAVLPAIARLLSDYCE